MRKALTQSLLVPWAERRAARAGRVTLWHGWHSVRAQVVDPQLISFSTPSVSVCPRAFVAKSVRRRAFTPFLSSSSGYIPGGGSIFFYYLFAGSFLLMTRKSPDPLAIYCFAVIIAYRSVVEHSSVCLLMFSRNVCFCMSGAEGKHKFQRANTRTAWWDGGMGKFSFFRTWVVQKTMKQKRRNRRTYVVVVKKFINH